MRPSKGHRNRLLKSSTSYTRYRDQIVRTLVAGVMLFEYGCTPFELTDYVMPIHLITISFEEVQLTVLCSSDGRLWMFIYYSDTISIIDNDDNDD